MSVRWDTLRARRQLKDKHSMDYFQAKVRLCRDLVLTFDEIRDHVTQGLYSKEVPMYAMSRTRCDENELLTDLLDWERMYALRITAGPAQVKSKESVKIVEPRRSRPAAASSDEKKSWRRMAPVTEKSKEAQGKVSDDVERGSCFYCHKIGHLTRDCQVRRKSITCFHCGVTGYSKSNCPELAQVNAVLRGDVPKIHTYLKVRVINGRKYSALIETGSSCTLFKSTVAVKSRLGIRPSKKAIIRCE